jgi:nucleotide-binding universal stress UspA family protein
MRILICCDGSPSSTVAVEAVASRPWPEGTQIKVLTVIHAGMPFVLDPMYVGAFIYLDHIEKARKHAPDVAERAAERLRRPGLNVTTEVLEGSPKEMILDQAAEWGADLIVLGTRGHGARRFLLGSVSHAVVLHAPCSVEIVRAREAASA